MISIIDYGAISDGKMLCTKNIQAAINTCANIGGTVYIPAGKYLCGTLHLYDNIHIYLEAGAVLLGSTNTRDHFEPDEKRDDPLYQDPSHSFYNHSLFVAKKCKNITFSGYGTIDMQSAWEMDERDFGKDKVDCKRGPGITENGSIKNIYINNLMAYGPYEPWHACIHDYFNQYTLLKPQVYTSSINGLEDQKIEKIFLSNVYIEVPGGEMDSMKDYVVPEKETEYPENVIYGKMPAYGLICRHCKEITLNNVNFKALEKDERDALILEDVIE